MEYKSKKKKKLKKLYEFDTYNNDDNSNDESLLDEDDKEKIFINNNSINDNKNKNKNINSKNKKILKENKKENNSFNYIVKIDKYIRTNNHNKKLLNERKESIPKNSISTSKYTYFNFLPKILFEQFSKIANIYFLIIAFFQVFKEISNSNGKPVILFPLFIVVSVNGIKDFYEDWKRKKVMIKKIVKQLLYIILIKKILSKKNGKMF